MRAAQPADGHSVETDATLSRADLLQYVSPFERRFLAGLIVRAYERGPAGRPDRVQAYGPEGSAALACRAAYGIWMLILTLLTFAVAFVPGLQGVAFVVAAAVAAMFVAALRQSQRAERIRRTRASALPD